MTLHLIPLNFLIFEENFILFFISVGSARERERETAICITFLIISSDKRPSRAAQPSPAQPILSHQPQGVNTSSERAPNMCLEKVDEIYPSGWMRSIPVVGLSKQVDEFYPSCGWNVSEWLDEIYPRSGWDASVRVDEVYPSCGSIQAGGWGQSQLWMRCIRASGWGLSELWTKSIRVVDEIYPSGWVEIFPSCGWYL